MGTNPARSGLKNDLPGGDGTVRLRPAPDSGPIAASGHRASSVSRGDGGPLATLTSSPDWETMEMPEVVKPGPDPGLCGAGHHHVRRLPAARRCTTRRLA